jgi:hypothetical protein
MRIFMNSRRYLMIFISLLILAFDAPAEEQSQPPVPGTKTQVPTQPDKARGDRRFTTPVVRDGELSVHELERHRAIDEIRTVAEMEIGCRKTLKRNPCEDAQTDLKGCLEENGANMFTLPQKTSHPLFDDKFVYCMVFNKPDEKGCKIPARAGQKRDGRSTPGGGGRGQPTGR